MKKNLGQKIKTAVIIISLLFLTIYPVFQKTRAADLSTISDVMTRMEITATPDVYSNHTITFTTPTGVAATETITVTFPTDFTGQTGIDYTDVDVTDNGSQLTLDATPSGTTWGAAFSSVGGTLNKLTITSDTGTITGTHVVVIKIGTNASEGAIGDKQIENPTTNGSKKVSLTCGASDTGAFALAIVDDDQIVYSATVDPSITVTFTANASNFGALPISAVTNAGTNIDVGVSTNAGTGMTLRAYDDGGGAGKPGLLLDGGSGDADVIGSVDSSYSATPVELVAGTEGYGIYAEAVAGGSGGTISIAADYAYTDNKIGPLKVGATNAVTVSTASAPIDQKKTRIHAQAAIDGLTKPGAYKDTVTVVVTGNF